MQPSCFLAGIHTLSRMHTAFLREKKLPSTKLENGAKEENLTERYQVCFINCSRSRVLLVEG